MFRCLSAAFLALLFVAPASACPVCDSETGKQVKAGILGGDFGFNLLATLLPFAIFLGITAAIYYGFPRSGSPFSRKSGRKPAEGTGHEP